MGSAVQLAEFVIASTGAWLVAIFDTVVCEASMEPRTDTQINRQTAKRLCSIRVSNFMVVLRE
jgi:hypothetical protein